MSSAPRVAAGDPEWLVRVQRDLARQEYNVAWQDRTVLPDLPAAYSAPNRAHGFRIYFTETGISLVPRAEEEPSWAWGLSWIGYGREGATHGVPAASLAVEGHRVFYNRVDLEESYSNGADGLRQVLVLNVPPEEFRGSGGEAAPVFAGEGTPLLVDLALTGGLLPAIAGDERSVELMTAQGTRTVRWSMAGAADARGMDVPARIEGFSETGLRGIRLVLDGSAAVYPVTIELLATASLWTEQSDQAGAYFGYSVATAGDVNADGYSDVIVGAPQYDNGESNEGRAFVYHGSAAGLSATPAWTAEANQPDAFFGGSVGTAGDVNGDGFSDIVVSAYLFDNGESNEGRAFVYHGSSAGLAASPAWMAESNQPDAWFGISVAPAGDVDGDGYSDVIIGSSAFTNGQNDEGRAYLYRGGAAGLAVSHAWMAEGDQETARFGESVATAGDVNGDGYADVIVGAPLYDNGEQDEGRAFVYLGSAAGLGAAHAWTAESDRAGSQLGISVATAGDVNGDGYADVILGASHYTNGEAIEGGAFVYHGSDTGLQSTPAWTGESNQAGAQYGRSVTPAGDVNGDGYCDVVVGAPQYDNPEPSEGRVFFYAGSAAGLSLASTGGSESDQQFSLFGYSTAAAGDVNGDGFADVIVGAYQYDNPEMEEGQSFLILGSVSGPSMTPWVVNGDQAVASFGVSAASAGDVNGDGYADVIVGASGYDNGESNEGRVFVFQGSATGLATTPLWMVEGNQVNARLGTSASAAGDVNGDGFGDIVAAFSSGRAFAYYGSAGGPGTAPDWTVLEQAGAGARTAAAGDVNGDGYGDVIIGTPSYDGLNTNEGRAYVYHGSNTGLGTIPAWTAGSAQGFATFGDRVATAGDVNGDGYSDVIIGALFHDDGQMDEGRAFVYHGSAAGLGAAPAWTADGNQVEAYFGSSVGTAGDVNGDGFADVIVGAIQYDNGQMNEGRAFVYHGSAAGLAPAPAWTVESNQVDATLGASVGTAGDVNGDGFADVVVTTSQWDNPEPAEGRVALYLGSAAGLATVASWTVEGNVADAGNGMHAATAGDVNGDGCADIIIASPGLAGVGRTSVYLGNRGAGLSLRPHQSRTGNGDAIAYLGASDSAESFRIGLTGRTPFGRGRVRLEREVKPGAIRFDGLNTAVGVHLLDTGTTGVAASATESGLFERTLYRWRVRLRYDPSSSPFAQRSRWLTIPWRGWREPMVRTAGIGVPAGSVPDGAGGAPLTVTTAGGGMITLTWEASCSPTDTDYAIYEGTLGSYTSHASRFCGTGGGTSKTFTPLPGSTYYLVVPLSVTREGSYGLQSGGVERPQGFGACRPQEIAGSCPP